MRCPYCGAEVVGRKCIFCTSDLIEHIKKNGLEVEDFAETTPVKKEAEKPKASEKTEEKSEETKENRKKKKKNRERNAGRDTMEEIRELCDQFLKGTKDGFGSYDRRRNLIGGKTINKRLFDVLGISEGEEVFLLHDDTLMGNGKNGFAITERGFYCKELFEGLSVIPYDAVKPNDVVEKGNSTVFLTDEKRTIVYHSGNKEVLDKLRILCEDILDALFEEE